jgi:hypothetical protein
MIIERCREMTYGPPGNPPPGPPNGGYGPPPDQSAPQGGYGPPQGPGASRGGYQAGYGQPAPVGSRSSFDPKAVNPLDWGLLAAPVLALIFSFFAYYEYKPTGKDAKAACAAISQAPASVRGELQDACDGVTNSAWHGFFGWFGVLVALIGAGLIAMTLFMPHVKLPVPGRLAALGAFVLAVISTLLALLIVPDGDYKGQTIDSGGKDTDAGHSFSYWVVLILLVGAAVLAFMRFQQTGGQLPGRAAQGASPYGNAPGFGAPHGYQQGYQQPGYQPPAQQQPGYQSPQQQPGYQQPGYQQPGYQQPGYQQPGYQQPGHQQPGHQAPAPPASAPPVYQPPSPQPPPAEGPQAPPREEPPTQVLPGYPPAQQQGYQPPPTQGPPQ